MGLLINLPNLNSQPVYAKVQDLVLINNDSLANNTTLNVAISNERGKDVIRTERVDTNYNPDAQDKNPINQAYAHLKTVYDVVADVIEEV